MSASASGAGAATDEEKPFTGLILGAGIGLELCTTSSCSGAGRSTGPGAIASLDVGYRPWAFLGFLAEGSFAAHALTPPAYTGQSGSIRNLAAFGGVRLYPVQFGGVEPWVGALVGFHDYTERVRVSGSAEGDTSARELRRVAGRFQLGLDIALGDHFAAGPYLSWDPQFAGVECTKRGANRSRCATLREPGLGDPPGAIAPGDQPQFLSIGAQIAFRP
jgi:hypothetical protein